MINIISKNLSQKTLDFLAEKQQEVNNKTTFLKQKDRAKKSWDGKTGSKKGNAAFTEIRTKLKEMNVGEGICNYCEQDTSTDIEHIFPKSLYPEKAFLWSNYLLACKRCNMDYKNANFAVFNPLGSANKEDLAQNTQPPNEDALLINPRSENAMDFLRLDIIGNTFLLTPINRDTTSRNYQRGNYTQELLGLNKEKLPQIRKNVKYNYIDKLERYSKIKVTTNFDELKEASHPMDRINENNQFENEKKQLLRGLEAYILNSPHPTVWKEIKRQIDKMPNKIQVLFAKVPEALRW